jgi:hypothetical protein
MPRNGSGTYVLPAGQPVVTLTSISSTVFNTLTTDLSNALTTSVATDGQTPMTANLPMGSNKITNLAAGTVSTDAVRYGQTMLLSGVNAMTANMDLGSFKITSLAKGTSSSDGARIDQAVSVPGSKNLRGYPNSSTPLTKYDLSADYVVLKDSSNTCIAFSSTGTKTCDFGAAGSAINSRDQAGAFTADSWVYVYWISDGTNINTLASLSATSPTLPGSYTYFCLATAVRWNVSSNIVPAATCGDKILYVSAISVLNSGTSTVEASISITSTVPPSAGTFSISTLSAISATAGGAATITANIRTITGTNTISRTITTGLASSAARENSWFELNNINNTLFYLISTTGSVSVADFSVWIAGFTLPNGST